MGVVNVPTRGGGIETCVVTEACSLNCDASVMTSRRGGKL